MQVDYEETLGRICGDDWRATPLDEREGAYGVALMMAFMDGSRPTPDELSKVLELDVEEQKEVEVPFRRLQVSGSFSPRFNARRDRGLNGWAGAQEGRTAWCHVAATASGWIGGGYYIRRENKAAA